MSPSSVPRAGRSGRRRCPSSPGGAPLPRALRRSGEEPREQEGCSQAGYDARPRGRAGGGDLRLDVARLLPAVVQRGGPGREGREAAPRVRMLVRAKLAGHVEPGREDLEPVRDARRAAGRGFIPGRMKAFSHQLSAFSLKAVGTPEGGDRPMNRIRAVEVATQTPAGSSPLEKLTAES